MQFKFCWNVKSAYQAGIPTLGFEEHHRYINIFAINKQTHSHYLAGYQKFNYSLINTNPTTCLFYKIRQRLKSSQKSLINIE